MPDLLERLVDHRRTDTKAGAGVFTYTNEERDQFLLARDSAYVALSAPLPELRPVMGTTRHDGAGSQLLATPLRYTPEMEGTEDVTQTTQRFHAAAESRTQRHDP